MYVKFDRVGGDKKDSRGSCALFISYMSKEDKKDTGHPLEWWFNQHGERATDREVLSTIDGDWQGMGKNTVKFTTGSINPSEREWDAMGKTDEERLRSFKAWVATAVTKEFAGNFCKEDAKGNPIAIAPDNVKIFFRLEHNRYYKGTDEEVLRGEAKSGDPKPGFSKHIHFIIATKTADGKYRINPKTKRTEFFRVDFFASVERSFDQRFDFKRRPEESFLYNNTLSPFLNELDTAALAREAFSEERAGREDEEMERLRRRHQHK
jgi:hypothetical protein